MATIKQTRIGEDVLAVLSTGVVEGNTFAITAGQLDPKLYKRVNMVLEEMGGKWNRKARVHIFDADPVERLDAVIATGSIACQSDYGFFPTPPHFARRLVELADVRPGMTCLEPSAGSGNIARELAAACGDMGHLTLFEIQPHLAAKLTRDFPAADTFEADFLEVGDGQVFDRVVLNPPFAVRQDIDHVRHAFGILKPGGKLVAVMSASLLYRNDRKPTEFRAFVEQHNGRIDRNPKDLFEESGTTWETVTVIVDKPA